MFSRGGSLLPPISADARYIDAVIVIASQAIVSAPLVLSVDLTDTAMLDRVWPILSNIEVIAVNQHWAGSPGQLLLTDARAFPSKLSAHGYYAYPGTLGQ